MNSSLQEQLQKIKPDITKDRSKTGHPENIRQHSKKARSKANGPLFTLSRKVNLVCLPVLGTVEVYVKRQDIVDALKKVEELPIRLVEYLKKLALIDRNNELTAKGQEFMNTALLPILERGLYHIWFAENDQLLLKNPILIQRIDAFATKNLNQYRRYRGDINQYLTEQVITTNLVIENDKSISIESAKVTIKSIEVLCDTYNKASTSLNWQLTAQSKAIISGKLNIEVSNKGRGNKSTPVERELSFNLPTSHNQYIELMDSIGKQLNGKWNNQKQYFSLPFSETIDKKNTLNDLSLKTLPFETVNSTSFGSFEIEEHQPLPITPLNSGDGEKWLEAWCKHYYQQKHKALIHSEKAQLEWLSQPELIAHDITPIQIDKMLAILGAEGKTTAYWQAAAGFDLMPHIAADYGVALTLDDNAEFELAKLINHLTNGRTIENIIISDRYFTIDHQQALLTSIAKKTGVSDGVFVTLEKMYKKKLPESWQPKFIDKSPDNHDRYWLFYTSGGLKCWKVSASLDFARENHGQWIVHGTPTFTPLDKRELPQYLHDIVEAFDRECV